MKSPLSWSLMVHEQQTTIYSKHEAITDCSLMEQAFIEHLLCAGTRVVTESPKVNKMWSWLSESSKPSKEIKK